MSNPLVAHYGHFIDFGPCLIGRNLNLLVMRGFANLSELAVISGPDVYDQYLNPSGTQRELDKKHAASCFEYADSAEDVIAEDDPRSFPEIILNARDRQVVEIYQVEDSEFLLDINSFSSPTQIGNGLVGVRVRIQDIEFPQPTTNPQISRVDGNHRLSGVEISEVLAEESEPNFVNVPFSLYVGLTTEQEVKLFRDINGEHKGMDVTHLTNVDNRLGGEALKTDGKQVHKWMAGKLAQPGKAFEGMVFAGGSKAGAKAVLGKVPPVRLNTLAGTLKLQMSKATLVMNIYGDEPDLVLELIDRYWKAVRNIFSEEWSDRTNFILLQTIGLSGFAQLGATLMDQGITDAKVEQRDFEVYLLAAKSQVDLSRTAEQWKGVAGAGGATRVAEILIKAATRDNAARIRVTEELRPTPDPGHVLD